MSVRISGDMLALDRKIKKRINQLAAALEARFPNQPLEIQARISEEFDQLHGHRVRCELLTVAQERQQVIVREARKQAEEAIDAAFAGLKTKLRRLRTRDLGKQLKQTMLHATGT
ncbi:HPF/RaiA family ribosome-associated protein [Thiohalocapsa marina]|uniref:HPF/RaiA family ribosome-associated protein n=1 Tax=Thiohalocapsa marina TaxID=424902 RepID=A0A5M8FKR0_9GAMM|nr:HPF/RaiA family ribosome-associated protein [Thiohalocapsa marina]KAA6184326.1 HPF/RaiA family ribosome-associated protein [Thiohalocapsa marina]